MAMVGQSIVQLIANHIPFTELGILILMREMEGRCWITLCLPLVLYPNHSHALT